jgi:hypothetical protein
LKFTNHFSVCKGGLALSGRDPDAAFWVDLGSETMYFNFTNGTNPELLIGKINSNSEIIELNPLFSSGKISISAAVGTESFSIGKDKIMSPKTYTADEWEKMEPRETFEHIRQVRNKGFIF